MMLDLKSKELNLNKSKGQDDGNLVKIFIVDDLNENLLDLAGVLKRADLEIFKVKSGTEALDLMMSHEFALALIDVKMPGMNGFELAELMRGAKKTKHIPIIFVTATAKEQSFQFKGYESGAVDFLLKPLNIHMVKSKVNIFIELYQHKKEQEELLAKLKVTQGKLEEAVSIRDEFMSIASHELKTPLTSLKLQSELKIRKLRKGDSSAFSLDRLTKMFDEDEKQIARIVRLVDDILDISRIDSGKFSIHAERFDLSEMAGDLIERTIGQFAAAGCSVETDFAQPVVGRWDRLRIEQVFMNLLTNAMRYGSGKPVFIQVTAVSGRAQIVVRDQGQGIAQENQDRIFQKFERATRESQTVGLGLGLYIVKKILEEHHGSIRVVSQLGHGTTFIIDLPTSEPNEGGS